LKIHVVVWKQEDEEIIVERNGDGIKKIISITKK